MLVALSGGPDSTALLLLLAELRRELGLELVGAHFDHALRDGSEQDVASAAELCGQLGIRLVRGRRRHPLGAGSLQAAARVQRHRFLEDVRRRTGSEVVALGHTADDVVEGLLLHLLRGSGLAGLRGMPERRGPIVRPLLWVWRRDIEGLLAARSVAVFRDPANSDPRHARTRIRLRLLPALERGWPGIAARLLRVARAAQSRQARLEESATALCAPPGLDLDLSREAAPVVVMEALRLLYGRAGGSQPGLDRTTLRTLLRLTREGRPGAGLDLPGGLRARRLYSFLEIGPALGESPRGVTLVRWTCRGCDVLGAVHLRPGAELSLGRRRPGLRMRPLPDRGSRKVQDILVDAKVPRHRRDELDLVFADGQLAWIPGVAVDARWVAPAGVAADHVELR